MGVINENQTKVNTNGPWLFNSNEKENLKSDCIDEKLYISPISKFSLSTTIDDKTNKELQKNLIFIFQNKTNNVNSNKNTSNLNKSAKNNFDKNTNLNSNQNNNYIQKYKSNHPILKAYPPNKPNLYNNIYAFSENDITYFSKRNCFAKINKFKIPNTFYNHFMIKNRENNNFYITSSLTKRTKGKLLTYIYYYPKRNK